MKIDPQVVLSGDARTPFAHRFAESIAAHAFEAVVRPNLLNLQQSKPGPADPPSTHQEIT